MATVLHVFRTLVEIAGATPRSIYLLCWTEFSARLRAPGWNEGENVVLAYRYAGNRLGLLPSLAVELVQLEVDVIVAA